MNKYKWIKNEQLTITWGNLFAQRDVLNNLLKQHREEELRNKLKPGILGT